MKQDTRRAARSMLAGAALLVLVILVGCSGQDDGALPDVLILGVLPDRTPDLLEARYAPLAEYLGSELGVRVELVIPSNYGDLVNLLVNGSVHVANFGGYTFIEAAKSGNAIPLVMRDIDARFTSAFIVGSASDASEIGHLRDGRFAFGSELSTSGHLMPRYFLSTLGIEPETFFSSIRYSGSHDATAFLVRDGVVDGGVVNAYVLRRLLADDAVRVIWVTPPYVDYVYAMHPRLGDGARTKLVNAFLRLSVSNPAHLPILESLDAGGFLPAGTSDFAELQSIIDNLGQRPEADETSRP